jgi:hypothetical protein
MATADPIQLLFGGMKKLSPGCDEDTVRVLRRLPRVDSGYPAMTHAAENISLAENAGYQLLGTHTLPRKAWFRARHICLSQLTDSCSAAKAEFVPIAVISMIVARRD